jgi:hypothetical protein
VPVFIIERRYAEQLDPSAEDIRQLNEVNAEEDVRWLMSFLSADKRKTYCLYEASSSPWPIAYRAAAVRLADCVFIRMLRT